MTSTKNKIAYLNIKASGAWSEKVYDNTITNLAPTSVTSGAFDLTSSI